MSTNAQNEMQRVRYYDDQLLTARDLRDDFAYEAWLRGLHVRALHNTWGVALGFGVYQDPEICPGAVVDPGLAYDCRGREIVSSRTICIGAPPAPLDSKAAAWWFDLVIRYRDQEDFDAEQRPGRPCPENGFQPLEEQPVWRWALAGEVKPDLPPPELADDIRLGEEVPLARVRVNAEGQIESVDYTTRRNAQGLVRPHLAGEQVEVAGSFDAANQLWSVSIDTSAAGFISNPPFYFAALAEYPCPLLVEDPVDVDFLQRALGPFVSIQKPAKTKFTLEIRFGAAGTEDFVLPCEPTFKVNWLGIEPVSGCPPPPLYYLIWPRPNLPGLGNGIFGINDP